MSAIKKQTNLRWSSKNEKSPMGATISTIWSATVGAYVLEVVNYPGTKSLDWKISRADCDWSIGSMVDRYEYTVSTLKDMVCRRAEELNALRSVQA